MIFIVKHDFYLKTRFFIVKNVLFRFAINPQRQPSLNLVAASSEESPGAFRKYTLFGTPLELKIDRSHSRLSER